MISRSHQAIQIGDRWFAYSSSQAMPERLYRVRSAVQAMQQAQIALLSVMPESEDAAALQLALVEPLAEAKKCHVFLEARSTQRPDNKPKRYWCH